MQEEPNVSSCLEFFKKEAIGCPSREIVGFLGIQDGKLFARLVKNRSPDPQNYFAVDPLEIFQFYRESEPIAIFHSHIYGDSQFSDWDIETSNNCLIPYLVYSVPEDKFNFYVPPHTLASSVNLERLKAVL